MPINLSESLTNLISGFDQTTPDVDIEIALIEFCKEQGFKVKASNATKVFAGDNGKRFFLVYFETSRDAILFASKSYCTTFGHNGVMVKIVS